MTSEPEIRQSKGIGAWCRKIGALYTKLIDTSDSLIPEALNDHLDRKRRARLLIRFGILGTFFGGAFASFYFLIGHTYGGVLVGIFTGAFALVPMALKHSGNLRGCSNLYILCVSAGFVGLSMIEGGMHGHAVAWLAVIPLCAMILTNRKDAYIWCGISIVLVGLFSYWHLIGIEFPETFPERFTPVVDAAGFAALVPFLILLGFIFEATRKRAFTQLESAMDQLTDANEGLVKMNTEKSEFLNIAAHDLKNPLSIITGFADLITSMDGLSEKDTKEFAGEISKSATRMLDIVTNLLDVRSIEDGKISLKKDPCKIIECIDRVHRDFEALAAKKDITLHISHRDPRAIACGDEVAISQILDNLISNAIKYSPHGSKVFVETREQREAIGIDVIDNGPGLSQEDQANLFKKFSRLTPQPTGDETSNGLGLWIVDRIANSMGGKVFCKSVLNEGSTFSLRLPVWDSTMERSAEEKIDFNRLIPGDKSDLILPS